MIGNGHPRRLVVAFGLALAACQPVAAEGPAAGAGLAAEYASDARPILERYCLGCHSTKDMKGDLDLERFASVDLARKDLKAWQGMIEQLDAGEMPPKGKPQPSADERARLAGWVRRFLEAEALARAGDPGRVGLRRLSHAEYDATVREITGVDLRPSREFPADGAAGEGFTNASEALGMSPTLLAKYLKAAKEIAAHAVLLPDGVRFAPSDSRRDWTDENVARLRKFYEPFTTDRDGRWSPRAYLAALVRHREALAQGKTTAAEVATSEKLNPKYLAILQEALSAPEALGPVGRLRSAWLAGDSDALGREVAGWQSSLWSYQNIGSYRYGAVVRQVPADPPLVDVRPLKASPKPTPGQGEVTLYLVARDLSGSGSVGQAVWRKPRFEGLGGPPLLLRDYADFGPRFEVDYAATFDQAPRHLAAAIDASKGSRPIEEIARDRGLDAGLLARWVDLAALPGSDRPGRLTFAAPLTVLGDRLPDGGPVGGWKASGSGLPSIVANPSGEPVRIPGLVPAHRVAMHPTPGEFVGVEWLSPIAGKVRVSARIAHAHPACGNGVAWWVEARKGDSASVLSEGTLDLGKETTAPSRSIDVAPGDRVLLAVDARDGSHSCDLTEVALTVADAADPARTWDLSADVADSIGQGNPHADRFGHPDAWRFVMGPTRPVSGTSGPAIPAASILGRWRESAVEPARRAEADALADRLAALLKGPRPADEKHPDRKLYDLLAAPDGPLFRGLEATLPKPREARFGLDRARFGGPVVGEADLVVPLGQVVEIRLPAALFVGYGFEAEGSIGPDAPRAVVQFEATTTPPAPTPRWDGKSPLVASPEARRPFLDSLSRFRRLFPTFLCYPNVLPLDEVVCLKTFHREDGPLIDLFLSDEQARQVDRMWEEHRFISRYPVVENEYLPLFIGFVTQDQPKELLAYFESQRAPFKARADAFLRDFEAAAPAHLRAVLDFAALAYRRPLAEAERRGLLDLYRALRDEGRSHEEATRGLVERVLVSPAFLYHLEEPPPGEKPGPLNDWELAARLSYFLWSAPPDDTLRKLAAEGRLREPGALASQARRMLRDDRARALAVEFGTQWLHVRGFEGLKEKNEALFPTFNEALRKSMAEESVLFFQDLFREDRAVSEILDTDATYLDETLARHYGIPGVVGPEWRRVEGVKKYGRGGILGLASVLTTQAGASRTSPVLRGNWVVETLLGEKLPKPPPGVPQLPDGESGNDGLTMRQLVEKHVNAPGCATCHQRIDPFGFSLERYDPIGRFRDKDLGGLPVDARSKLRDGAEFEGIEGLRSYLLDQKRSVFFRLFSRRLVGYALGREVALADRPLIDAMVSNIDRPGGRVGMLVEAIVESPQFRMIRGGDYPGDE